MTEEKDWTKDMKDRLARHRVAAPDGLLADIRWEMARRGLKPGQDKRAAVSFFGTTRFRVAAAVAAMVVAGAGWYVASSLMEKNAPEVARRALPANQHAGGQQWQETGRGTGTEVLVAMSRPASSTVFSEADHGIQYADIQPTLSPATEETLPSAPVGGLEEREQQPDAGRSENGKQDSYSYAPTSKRSPEQSFASSGRHPATAGSRPIAFSAYFSGVGSASAANNGYAVSMMSQSMQHDGVMSDITSNESVLLNAGSMPMLSASEEVHAHHRQPIKVGVSLRLPLSGRWSMTTGVDYSYLSSDIEVVSVSCVTGYDQQLHYVGVPVMMNYNLWRSPAVNVYLSGGGEMQYLVSGKVARKDKASFSAATNSDKTVMSLSDHKPQWSVGVTAGAEVRVGKGLSVYVEPGLNYYFDNGSSIRSIYQDKSVNFSLGLGLRWTLGE